MAPKRKSENEGDDRNLDVQSKRRDRDSERIMIRAIGNLRFALTIGEIGSVISDLVRRVVREEVPRQLLQRSVSGLQFHCSSAVHHIGASGAKTIHLRFANNVASQIFTKSAIKSEGDKLVKIELVDAKTQAVIKEGHRSSLKIRICVLKGEFGSMGGEDWTAEQFDANILHEREGKEPLLIGETLIRLQNGQGTITNLVLTDNSHWTRNGKFRLGAKCEESSPHGDNIREGISEPFKVKDRRGEEYKKHHPPLLNDDIWRLVKISKNNKLCERLFSEDIKTVKDLLLQLQVTSPSSLQKKLEIPKKKWEAIIKHARECNVDKNDYKEYIYLTDHQQPEQMRLLFNPIFELVGVAFNGQSYRRPDTLTAAKDKDIVEIVKQHAYKNEKDWTSINEATKTSLLSQLAAASPHQSLRQTNMSSGFPTVNSGQPENLAGSTSQSSYAGGDQHLLLDNDFFRDLIVPESLLPLANAPPQYSSIAYVPQSITLGQYAPEHGIPYIPNSATDIARRGTSKSMWYKILAAFRCFM